MSWREKIDIAFRITTGDGVTYSPLLAQENTMNIDLMAGSFEFPGIDGSLVKRKSSTGENYQLLFYFQGDNHLDVSDNFIESSKNKKPWSIEHPKYGELYVHPLTIRREDSSLNITVFRVEVRKTIIESYPNTARSKIDQINNNIESTKITSSRLFGLAVKSASTEDKLKFTSSLESTVAQYEQSVNSAEESTNLENAYQKSLRAVNSLNISTIQEFMLVPATSASNVGSRLSQLSRAYNQLDDFSNFNLKEYFQAIGASILAGMCLSAITPNEGDYSKRKDVNSVANTIKSTYTDYIEKLGMIQDENLSVSNSFNPDPEVVRATEMMIKETVSNLNEVIFGALVENTYIVPAPTNIILLTHLLIGRVTDETINELVSVNDFTRDELVQIKKSREVIYYA